ncbi:hypothetical protein KSP35_05440 [Aquihabitans sp. G128]|nr:hypothetical protein KSP35_05440 [Aquihabitans sp. G128]
MCASAVRGGDGAAISFHRVDSYSPPVWPGQDRPQQMHVDVLVDDLDVAEEELLGLGASKHEQRSGLLPRATRSGRSPLLHLPRVIGVARPRRSLRWHSSRRTRR